jgi:transcriptional regulator with XRE-family HTH domain
MGILITMQAGSEQFKDWMRRRGFTQADAARYLEFEESYVSVLTSGKRSPGLANAILIERHTGIPVEAWTSTELDESAEPAPVHGGKRKTSQGVN